MLTDNYENYLKILKQAQKDGERAITGYTGRTPSDTLADLTTGLPAGQIWVRINGQADPYNALYESFDVLQPNTAVKLVFDSEADSWVAKSINASVVIYDNGGTTAPTFGIAPHDHTSASSGGDLGADTVDTTQLVDDAVTQAKIDSGAVGTTELADLAVTSGKLASNAVTTDKITDANVTLAKMATNSVDTTQLVDDSVTTAKIDAGAVGTTELADLGVTSAKLGTNAVTTAKIADANVTLAKMATNSVDTSQIVDDAVTPTKTDGLTGSSVAFVLQTASDTFTDITENMTSGAPLLYDGSEIRAPYYAGRINSGSVTTSGTAVSVVETSFDMASIANTLTLRLRMQSSIMVSATGTTNNYFRFMWQYNYDNSGAEGWQNYWYQQFFFGSGPLSLPMTLTSVFYGIQMTSPTWGYSGTNYVRLVVYRSSGSDNLTVNSAAKGSFLKTSTWEELRQ